MANGCQVGSKSQSWRQPVVGMVGAGQLARMTQQAALDYGIEMVVLARSETDPAVQAGARCVIGRPDSLDDLAKLAASCDVVTFDHELAPALLIDELVDAGVVVRPGPQALRLAQDKLLARQMLGSCGFEVPEFVALGPDPLDDLLAFGSRVGWPVVVKTARGGYDGRGVAVAEDPGQAAAALASLSGDVLMAEQHVNIAAEIAVVAARSPSGLFAAYPVVGTHQEDGMCRELVMPAPIPDELSEQAVRTAKMIADGIDAVGIIAVELFVTAEGSLVVNELALRPHNSGHATIEAAATSQFHNHLRAILDWPLGETTLHRPAAAMVNVVGAAGLDDPQAKLPEALAVGASVHLYGKSSAPGRKIGHVTAVGETTDKALERARTCAEILNQPAQPPRPHPNGYPSP